MRVSRIFFIVIAILIIYRKCVVARQGRIFLFFHLFICPPVKGIRGGKFCSGRIEETGAIGSARFSIDFFFSFFLSTQSKF